MITDAERERIIRLESQEQAAKERAFEAEQTGEPDHVVNYWRRIARDATALIDAIISGDNATTDATIERELTADITSDDVWHQTEFGTYSERITRFAHAKKLNVWRANKGKYAGNLMCGRVRLIPASEHNGNLPAAICTHCNLAFSPAGNTRDHYENFTILVIAHGHNDGPAYARRYTIAEQSCYSRGTTKAQRNAVAKWQALRLLSA